MNLAIRRAAREARRCSIIVGMLEVHVGARPGRPVLLTVLTAALLILSLGAAWLQVRSTRTLGPASRVGDSPLLVRPPVGWRADPRDPSLFILWLNEGVRGADVPKRSVRFGYDPNPRSANLRSYLRRLMRGETPGSTRPAQIGGFDGLQISRERMLTFRRRAYQVQTIVRIAMTPTGEMLFVEYTPFSTFTPADAELLDSICAAVRVEDALIGAP